MSWKWTNEKAAKRLLNKLDSNFTLKEDGSVASTLESEIYIDALLEFVKFDGRVSRKLAFECLEKTIINNVKANQGWDTDVFLDDYENLFKSTEGEEKSFSVVLPILPLPNLKLFNTKFDECVIRFYDSCPKKYKSHREKLIEDEIDEHKIVELALDYVFCVVSVEAHDEDTAFEKAYSSVSVYRGFFEVSMTKTPQISISGRTKLDYSLGCKVPLGQFYTVHNTSGKIATRKVWYQEGYRERRSLPCKDSVKQKSLIKKFLNYYINSPFKDHLRLSLNALMDSVDSFILEYRYLKLHTAIEIMLKSDESKLINKRLAFPPASRLYDKDLIESLRISRNKLIHAGVSDQNLEMKTFLLTMLYNNYLGFLLGNWFDYNSVGRIIDFTTSGADSLNHVKQKQEDLDNLKKVIEIRRQ